MANKTIFMSRIRQLLRMYARGTGKKQISATTGVAGNTIKKYLQRFISLKVTYADIDTMKYPS
jgi:DNA-binding NarL/FixJ family response regulator